MKKQMRDRFQEKLVRESLKQNRSQFFDNMGEILDEARKGEIGATFAIEHFITLDQVNEIMPTQSNRLDHVEFRAGPAKTSPVFVE